MTNEELEAAINAVGVIAVVGIIGSALIILSYVYVSLSRIQSNVEILHQWVKKLTQQISGDV